MATSKVILGIICLIVNYGSSLPNCNFLTNELSKKQHLRHEQIIRSNKEFIKQSPNRCTNKEIQARQAIIAIANSQLGVREATGKNDGKEVEAYLNYTGQKKGAAWCASFVSWVFGSAGFAQPKTAWSPALFPSSHQTLKPLPADIFGVYFKNLKRIAHCGLVEKRKGNWIYTIEGNTNPYGSREGDGVYRKIRHMRSIKYYASWISHGKDGLK